MVSDVSVPERFGSYAISLLKELVRIPSVNPYDDASSGGEKEIAEFIASTLDDLGLKVSLQHVNRNRRNVIGTLKGGSKGSIMLNAHLDTVGVTGMTIDPFLPTVKNGRLYGRGSCDTKSSAASMIAAIKWLVEENTELKRDVIFAGVADEEFRSAGTRELIKKHITDAAIVGEPTGGNVATAHKGYAWIEINTRGRAAHGSVPEAGLDAIEKTGRIVTGLAQLNRTFRVKHPLLGKSTLHMSRISGGNEWAIIPDSCTLQIERRLLPGESGSSAIAEVRDVISELTREDKDIRADAKLVFEQKPAELAVDNPFVRRMFEAYRNCFGKEAEFTGLPYWTDASLLINDAGIPTCIFGPGDIRLAHGASEHVSLSEVTKSVAFYREAVLCFCGNVQCR